ncbi:Crp/Fnr family transcriptional regulator [Pelagibius sp.]|uniref:Crp/Fnr family transcriptional regulator n=1 Tax=Pelagibius sp. TaxID=1931238 RepID=UPI002611C638|nr:cyclic nucleotide-binding domain-containing protein [Pelagibius sp.]
MAESKIHSIAEILAAHPCFAGLDPAITDLLGGCASNVHFANGRYLFKAEEAADTFYLLRGGDVALELRMPGRGRLTVQTLHPGQVVGASWILPPYRWRFDARAVGDVRATGIDAACLRGKCDDDPSMGYQVMQRFLPIVAERLQTTRLRLIDLYAPPAEVGNAL